MAHYISMSIRTAASWSFFATLYGAVCPNLFVASKSALPSAIAHRGLGRQAQCRHSVHDPDLDIDRVFDHAFGRILDTEHLRHGIVAVPGF